MSNENTKPDSRAKADSSPSTCSAKPCRKQREINRLRKVLHDISASRPDAHMDIDKLPELTTWICDTCRKASVGAYATELRQYVDGREIIELRRAGEIVEVQFIDNGKLGYVRPDLIKPNVSDEPTAPE